MKTDLAFWYGIFKNNPIFRLVLGLCPTLAVTTSLENALGMGLAATFVLICSNGLVSALRKVIPGAQIPELISHDIDGKAHSTLDIKAHYTVLWFWDPDCDHCQEMTPPLHQLYQEYGKDYDFEVFAVEVNDDYERWKAFSDKHQLWDWTNLSTSRGEANLDFIEYFDIMTTPVMFLIDNTQNHTIIARQITLDELRSFFKK